MLEIDGSTPDLMTARAVCPMRTTPVWARRDASIG
jgi:hypothetical protein